MLGADSSAHDYTGGAHVDFLLSRPALLGPAQAHAGSPQGRLVGRKQDRLVAAAHRDFPGMAGALPRSAAHSFGLSVSIGFGPVRSGKARKVLTARGFVDLWPGGSLRAPRRRQRRCLPLWI